MCLSLLTVELISARYLIYVPAWVKKKDKSRADFRCLTFTGAPPKRNVSKAQVAELVDALASGASVRMDVEVRVFSWAPFSSFKHRVSRSKPLIFKHICLRSRDYCFYGGPYGRPKWVISDQAAGCSFGF